MSLCTTDGTIGLEFFSTYQYWELISRRCPITVNYTSKWTVPYNSVYLKINQFYSLQTWIHNQTLSVSLDGLDREINAIQMAEAMCENSLWSYQDERENLLRGCQLSPMGKNQLSERIESFPCQCNLVGFVDRFDWFNREEILLELLDSTGTNFSSRADRCKQTSHFSQRRRRHQQRK